MHSTPPSLLHRLPLLALLLCLPLLSTGCVTASTKASRARTERPTLPVLPTELVRPERVKPLDGMTSGQPVTIDRGVLTELYERLAETTAAIERGNNRAGGVKRWWTCVDAIWRTGKTPAECGVAGR